MVIDSHLHLWQYNPVRDAWIDDSMKILQRDFLPADLEQELKANAIDGCVAVQADQSEAETFFLLDLAEKSDFIKGVVGWVDLRSEQVENRLSHFSKYPKLKGFRHIVQGESDVNFMLRKDFLRGISLLGKYGFTYDILVYPHQLGTALELAKHFPHQKFVIDHMAKPYIKDGFFEGWAALMAELGKLENVWCKLSGMVTEADWNLWKYEDLLPYLDHVFDVFKMEKLMYGSDWPVCLLAADYGSVKSVVMRYLSDFPEEVKAGVWGGNAKNFYHLI